MSNNIFEFGTDNQPILIELDDSVHVGGMVEVSAASGAVGKAKKNFEDSLDTIEEVANAVQKKVNSSSSKPAEIKVEFGLKFSAEAGAIIAKTAVEAHIKLTLTWKNG